MIGVQLTGNTNGAIKSIKIITIMDNLSYIARSLLKCNTELPEK